MEKKFFEAFKTLQLKPEDAELFEETRISRLVFSSRRDRLHVYMTGDYLISKDKIFMLESEIAKQLFKGTKVEVKVIESFNLSSQHSAESVFNQYKPSMILEASAINPIWGELLSHADFAFSGDGNILTIVLEDRVIARDHIDDMLDYIEHALNGRCSQKCDIRTSFKERETRKSYSRNNERIEEEVRRITRLAKGEAAQEDSSADSAQEEGGTEIEQKAAGVDNAEQDYYAQMANDAAQDAERSLAQNDAVDIVTAPKEASESIEKVPKRAESGGSYSKKGYYSGKTAARSRMSDNPDVVFGRDFDDEPMKICDVIDDVTNVTIRGEIISYDVRDTRKGKKIVSFAVTDYTDTIKVKLFPKEDQQERLFAYLGVGKFVIVKGVTGIDDFDKMLSIGYLTGIKKCSDFRVARMDNDTETRVELHCHTKMSDMDGVSDVTDIISCAAKWGHPALAITDHGDVQAFTEAFHKLQKMGDTDFKVIYGVEGYLVDDEIALAVNPKEYTIYDRYVVFDIETTGFSPENNKIIEIGAVKIENGKVIDTFSTFVNPSEPIPYRIQKLTGINDEMVLDAPFINDTLTQFKAFCEDSIYVAHNARFDMSFLKAKEQNMGIFREYSYVDTLGMVRILVPEISKYTLDNVAKALNVGNFNHHRAVDDAKATAEIFISLCKRLEDKGITTLAGLNELDSGSTDRIMKGRSNHVIILAKNETGRVNLYRLVSMSNLKYFHRTPRIPKSELAKYREGLIIGSACEQGELYQAIVGERGEEEIARIVRFYDYLEIQPNGNNAFMIRSEHFENINSEEDLNNINRKIVALGEQFNKPVVATCDVHFLNPEDEIYRRVLMAGKGFEDADMQAPLYLRTTEEMLKEFEYLGYEKAYEVVVTNTRKIADQVDKIEPVRPDKCPPVIEDSDKTLREICYRRAHELYGENLPEQVSGRLEKELSSIIKNGFAVMYIIAQKLVWKSNEDGYLVGSRGSVGSSFVATMAGITEVNPLSPHYYCDNCHYSDFTSDEVKAYAGRGGCDMPDKACPVCGSNLKKDGFDIPFETFLGFKGDKEPDIDLNFSGDYQSKAHKYTEVIFGAGQTFRAGTIGTIAAKTAYGYVKKYFEEHGISKRPCEIDRISEGCVGVRRTTGQHPGGIVVLPLGEEIHSFTPVQHPANDMTTDIVTTHFDYHSIDHNLLKLDILGHDDPTMIRMLQDLTDTDPQKVPLDDQKVMSLFSSTEALGITPEQIGGCPLGCLGIPEFGTDFVIQMLLDTKPTAFSDLVRISGLSHGTDVWLNNAQEVIRKGLATISTAICTRDDIMIYLIGMGVDSALSFTIMESVRKGKGLKDEWVETMKANNVPDWYIDCCRKIKYMFPKAHAAAYVMMGWRIAYYKINYPLAYYAAFFSIRASSFSYELMCMGKDVLAENIEKYRKMDQDDSVKMSAKEEDTLKDMRIVEEFYARGFEFMPIDIAKVKAHHCQIFDGKIMPRLDSIDGMGDKAADAVVDAVKDGVFLSRDDFKTRAKVSQTTVDKMVSLGILADLPESNQLSLFDLI